MKILILAGGEGTRLWPLSRQDFPKQFLHFGDQGSFLQKTVKRFLGVRFVEEIVVTTNQQYKELVEHQLRKIDPQKTVDVLIEPARRNTAAAIALGVKYLEEKKGAKEDSTILVIPSDHLIEPESVFLRFLEEAEPFAKKDRIVLFGIRPQRPESGYGYIQIGTKDLGPLYCVKRFVEKPERLQAEHYLVNGDYYWNAGIFAFSPMTFWTELATYAPEIYAKMQGSIISCLSQFSELPNLSIDYAVLEKTKKNVVCPLPISWSDVGCWDSVYEALGKDRNQNVKIGNVLELDTKNSLILGGKKLISTIGLEDVLVIETEEATFISKRGESQKVKALVQELIKTGQSKELYSWGHVKLLYTSIGFQITIYQIKPHQSHIHTVIEGNTEEWRYLSGRVEFKCDDKADIRQSFRFEKPSVFEIKNVSEEIAEILLVSFGCNSRHK